MQEQIGIPAELSSLTSPFTGWQHFWLPPPHPLPLSLAHQGTGGDGGGPDSDRVHIVGSYSLNMTTLSSGCTSIPRNLSMDSLLSWSTLSEDGWMGPDCEGGSDSGAPPPHSSPLDCSRHTSSCESLTELLEMADMAPLSPTPSTSLPSSSNLTPSPAKKCSLPLLGGWVDSSQHSLMERTQYLSKGASALQLTARWPFWQIHEVPSSTMSNCLDPNPTEQLPVCGGSSFFSLSLSLSLSFGLVFSTDCIGHSANSFCVFVCIHTYLMYAYAFV